MGQGSGKASIVSKHVLIVPVALSITIHMLVISATGLVDMHLGTENQEKTITVDLAEAQKSP